MTRRTVHMTGLEPRTMGGLKGWGFTVTFTEPAHTAAEGLASPASVADEQPANTKDALKPSNENFATVPHMGPVT